MVELESLGFSFDQENNRYICPEGKLLLPYERKGSSVYKSKSLDCMNCPKNTECPASLRKCSTHIRHIYRSHKQSFYETEQQKMNTDLFKSKLHERMWKIEGINAEAKNLHSLKRAKYRGLTNMQIQAYMIGVVLNLKRLVQARLPLLLLDIFVFCINQINKASANIKSNLTSIVDYNIHVLIYGLLSRLFQQPHVFLRLFLDFNFGINKIS